MANNNRFSKPVAFNTKNESDNTILEYCKKRNFSGFAKKAMLHYIEHMKQEKPVSKPVAKKEPVKLTPVQKPKASERIERMKQQVKQPQATVFKPKMGGF